MNPDEFSRFIRSYYEESDILLSEFIYVYSDLRGFATAVADDIRRDDLLQMLVDPLLQAGATLVTPTFTYTTSGRFEVTETQTRLGALNKWMLKQAGVRRSEHPLFSDAAIGPQAEIVENIGKSAFGKSSVFDRLRDRHCGFLHLGQDLGNLGQYDRTLRRATMWRYLPDTEGLSHEGVPRWRICRYRLHRLSASTRCAAPRLRHRLS